MIPVRRMPKKMLIASGIAGIVLLVGFVFSHQNKPEVTGQLARTTETVRLEEGEGELYEYEIAFLKRRTFEASPMLIEQTLAPGSNYARYIASHESDGLKIYGLLTIPNGTPPENGWPIIVFNHGYIDPAIYRTTERYVSYQDGFARNGYITFKSDYRGHGESEGVARGNYGNSDYIIDVLNATASLRAMPESDPDRVGMWGHSMGGWITHRAMVVDPGIKAGVIWAGVVGGHDDLLELWDPHWVRNNEPEPTPEPGYPERLWWSYFPETFGSPAENPEFWNRISAVPFLADMGGPIQLHHGTADTSVPETLSERFYEDLAPIWPESELYIYPGDDHNVAQNFSSAMRESVRFFDTHVKGE